MRLRFLPGKLRQVTALPPTQWVAFVREWLGRQKTGTVPCVINGCSRIVRVPMRDYYESYGLFCEEVHCREEIQFFLDQLKPGDVLYDIGAFRGVFSVATRLKLGNQVSIHIFEPLAKNADAIRQICKLNAFDAFKINQMAVSNGNALSAWITEDMVRMGDMRATVAADFPSISVDAYIASGNPPPTIIKLDVEGFELQVLLGAVQSLKQYRPRLWLEVHPSFLKAQGHSQDDILNSLRQTGYTISFFADYALKSELSYHIWCH
jgi:FkbM family methyltransferase